MNIGGPPQVGGGTAFEATVWVDESGRPSAHGMVYVVAAVRLTRPMTLDRLTAVLRPGQRYLHWRDASRSDRREIVGVLNELSLDVYIATAIGIRPKRQESARRLCLAALVREASADGGPLDSIVIEGRGRQLDLSDEFAVHNEARVVQPGKTPKVSFVAKTASPMLWVADAVSSMASAHYAETSGSDHWWRSLQAARLTLRRVEA